MVSVPWGPEGGFGTGVGVTNSKKGIVVGVAAGTAVGAGATVGAGADGAVVGLGVDVASEPHAMTNSPPIRAPITAITGSLNPLLTMLAPFKLELYRSFLNCL
jgi:hypothetical protein